jgi:hypothetical protein
MVVIDSGIWISAIHFGGVPAEALEPVIQMDDLAICSGMEQEVFRILEQNSNAIQKRYAPE